MAFPDTAGEPEGGDGVQRNGRWVRSITRALSGVYREKNFPAPSSLPFPPLQLPISKSRHATTVRYLTDSIPTSGAKTGPASKTVCNKNTN